MKWLPDRLRRRSTPASSTVKTYPPYGGVNPTWPWNFWQMGEDEQQIPTHNSTVEACVSAIAQTAAMVPIHHIRTNSEGTKRTVMTSALSRIAWNPNSYQARSDFIENLLRAVLLTGNGYAYAQRDSRFEISAMHLLQPTAVHPYVAPDDPNEVYYSIGGNPMVPATEQDVGTMVPARDILHVRMYTPVHPLIGETPLVSAALAVKASTAIQAQGAAFFNNMSRPSGVLSTDLVMSREQVNELRQLWNEQSNGLNAGGVPILTAGLKFLPISMNAVDAAIVDTHKLNVEAICQVFRVPMAILGSTEDATYANANAVIDFWVRTGLGFYLDRVEAHLTRLFGLSPPAERAEFAVDMALLRAAIAQRMETWQVATQSGTMSINEVRAREGLAPVEYGDEPRVQQQVVPLSYWEQQQEAEEARAEREEREQARLDATPPPPPEMLPDLDEAEVTRRLNKYVH